MQAIIFDIETGPLPEEQLRESMPAFDEAEVKVGNIKDPEKIKAKIESARQVYEKDYYERAALDATRGQVLAIGYQWVNAHDDRDSRNTVCIDGSARQENWQDPNWQEPAWLFRFWQQFQRATANDNVPIIGFNIFSFDLPFLLHRSWLLGVDVPIAVREQQPGGYARWHPCFVDLMRIWQCGNNHEYISLDRLAKLMGVGGKPDGVTGADFARLWEEDRKQAEEYLLNDLEMTHQIALRMGVV